ncbi:hypothetical protein [Serratia quinivorans]|uniref:hypothetical protein n=1 Tax=Serratia quinivorans TaxID=137545 RepID=UPI0021BDA46B|nr:hypothetical protein [Serratia quinivorans]
MKVIEILMGISDGWHLFGDMPDEKTLKAELTAVYLDVSIKTLACYRQNGDSPPNIQYQAEDSRARNQRMNYLLGDLCT